MKEFLREKRLEKGMSQEELAKEAGISRCYYAQIENITYQRQPSVKVAKKIAAVLDINWTSLYQEEIS